MLVGWAPRAATRGVDVGCWSAGHSGRPRGSGAGSQCRQGPGREPGPQALPATLGDGGFTWLGNEVTRSAPRLPEGAAPAPLGFGQSPESHSIPSHLALDPCRSALGALHPAGSFLPVVAVPCLRVLYCTLYRCTFFFFCILHFVFFTVHLIFRKR